MIVTGIFQKEDAALDCINRLSECQIGPEDISILGSSAKRLQTKAARTFKVRRHDKYMISAAVVSAAVGALLAVCARYEAPTQFSFVGPVTIAMVGAIGGCMVGTLFGAILGSSTSEFTGNVFYGNIKGQSTAVRVGLSSIEKRRAIEEIMESCGAIELRTRFE